MYIVAIWYNLINPVVERIKKLIGKSSQRIVPSNARPPTSAVRKKSMSCIMSWRGTEVAHAFHPRMGSALSNVTSETPLRSKYAFVPRLDWEYLHCLSNSGVHTNHRISPRLVCNASPSNNSPHHFTLHNTKRFKLRFTEWHNGNGK